MSEVQDEMHYLWKTDTARVTTELKAEVLKQIARLKQNVEHLEDAVRRSESGHAIPYGWVQNVLDPLDCIRNDIGRINGAVLVRGTK